MKRRVRARFNRIVSQAIKLIDTDCDRRVMLSDLRAERAMESRG